MPTCRNCQNVPYIKYNYGNVFFFVCFSEDDQYMELEVFSDGWQGQTTYTSTADSVQCHITITTEQATL